MADNKRLELIIGLSDQIDMKGVKSKIDSALKEIGSKKVQIRQLDTRNVEVQIRRFTSSMLTSIRTVGNTAQTILANSLKGGFMLGVAGLGTIGLGLKTGIDLAGDFEQTSVAIRTMMKDTEKAGKLLQSMSDFAAETPFEFPEIAKGGKQLLAYGFNAESIIPNLRMLGDVASGLSIPLGELIAIYGKSSTQTAIMTGDLNMFLERGIPILDELGKVLGVSKDKIKKMAEDGKIKFADLEKAFKNLTSAGGMFEGGMVNQSKTLKGLFSTLADNLTIVGREIMGISNTGDIAKGSIMERMKELTTFLIDWTGKNKDNITKFVTDIIKKFEDFMTNSVFTKDNISKMFETFEQNKDKAIDTITKLAEGAWNIGKALAELTPHIVSIVSAIGKFAKENPEFTKMLILMTLLINPIIAIGRTFLVAGRLIQVTLGAAGIAVSGITILIGGLVAALIGLIAYSAMNFPEFKKNLIEFVKNPLDTVKYSMEAWSGNGEKNAELIKKDPLSEERIANLNKYREKQGLEPVQLMNKGRAFINSDKGKLAQNNVTVNINGVASVEPSALDRLNRMIQVGVKKAA